ncbi:MAG: NYN domain-containing protein [Clostridia bacterium]
MLEDRKIALFIDVDNLGISETEYNNALTQLDKLGDILYGKAYGVSDKKHKAIIDSVLARGFDMCSVMRIKKRGAKVFDNRIIVDCLAEVLQNNNIDTVAILAAPADSISLYSKLKSFNISIIALDNNDEENGSFVNMFLDMGIVEHIKPVKKAVKVPFKAKPVEVKPIEQVKPIVEEPIKEVKPIEQVKPIVEEPIKEVKQEQPPKQVEEDEATANLINAINSILKSAPQEEAQPELKEAPKQQTKKVEAPAQQPEQIVDEPIVVADTKPQANYIPSDELQVLKELEDFKSAQKSISGEDAELLDTIRRLIDENHKKD